MKTIITVLLAVVNVTFGVQLGSVNKGQEAASFYLLDNCYTIEDYYEKK